MLLEADSERLYVGARGAVFALNASDISASSALTVSLFCFHVVAYCVPQLPHLQISDGLICIPQHRNFEATVFHFEAKVFIPLPTPCV